VVSLWRLVLTRQAEKDAQKLASAKLKSKTDKLFDILANNPFQNPPSYEKLSGELAGCYARRINRQHRLVYQVFKEERIIKLIRMWTHYE
jgi:Txe/YoeB family toxin of toxin-antitoxin system